jgi:hypothetical protein
VPENVLPIQRLPEGSSAALIERLEEAIPAKWLREVQRVYAETGA